jgi:arylsulfatase A-like enzyme
MPLSAIKVKGTIDHNMLAESQPNVLLITVDCLRYDHLGCFGYPKETSPHIDDIAGRGAAFSQCISNGANTSAAFPSILASALPPIVESEHKDIIQKHVTLAEVFKEAGYNTAAFHSNPLLTRYRHYDKGFDTFDEGWSKSPRFLKFRIKVAEGILKVISNRHILTMIARLANFADSLLFASRIKKPYAYAEELTSQARTWLDCTPGKFFLWLHFMDVHVPYMPPQKYIRLFHGKPVSTLRIAHLWRKARWNTRALTRSEIDETVELYDASIRYVDDSIGQLINYLGDRLENTLVVIAADHGDEFAEHGRTSHLTVYDGILRVPLILMGKGINPGCRIASQVGIMDMAPTMLELAGINKPDTFKGCSLLPLLKGNMQTGRGVVSVYTPFGIVGPEETMLYVMFAYRTPSMKYIRTVLAEQPGQLVSEEIYDLQQDPSERHNLHGSNDVEITRFKQEAVMAIEQLVEEKRQSRTSLEKLRIRQALKKLRA